MPELLALRIAFSFGEFKLLPSMWRPFKLLTRKCRTFKFATKNPRSLINRTYQYLLTTVLINFAEPHEFKRYFCLAFALPARGVG